MKKMAYLRNVTTLALDPSLCTGCGTCAATCPSSAIQQAGFSDEQVYAEMEALLEPLGA